MTNDPWKPLHKRVEPDDSFSETTMAMNVPGGVVLRVSMADHMLKAVTDTMVFVPHARVIEDEGRFVLGGDG